ncbi:WD40-like Beta Propeller Repeat [Marivirga sericea]|uniref:WD40-like Beta Propeller Repeat n=1 Tax=Marivirga sericea TaxID=1028 RepID=A0A1X7ICS2_9BACT|nr:OmpA family protein [Marivirga sericea]SMG11936.1 WD40-like Beta Propeller Repeat [Marivirga sericea]
MKSLIFWTISTALIVLIYLPAFGQKITKINLSDSINSQYTETKPMISVDGKTLYFARQNAPGNINGDLDDQDIYISSYGDKGFGKAKNAGTLLNNERANGVVSLSSSGETLFLLNTYEESGNNDGVSTTQLVEGSWTIPKAVPIQDFHNNSNYIDYFFSSSGKELLLAVERDDTQGDQDLYVSKKGADGTWQSPINLGKQINTKHPEFSPFLAVDNKTLFFSSMGHENYGSADIFYTKRLDSTWTNWSEPQNLGPDVNSEEFEAYYTIPANGAIGYYVSSNGGREGSRDIFSITIPYQFRPDPVILLRGEFIADQEEEDSINYHVNFLTTSASESEVNIEYDSNHFNAILPTGGSYFFYVNKSGYISESHYIDLTDQKEYQEETADIHTIPIQEGAMTVSHNLQFSEKSSEFFQVSYFELVRLLEVFKQYDSLQLELTGHAYDFEDSLKNWRLSEERLLKIQEFYVDQGFDPDQFILTPKGSTEPNEDAYKKHVNSQFDINNRIAFKITNMRWEAKDSSALMSNAELDVSAVQLAINAKEEQFRVLFAFDDDQISGNQEVLLQLKNKISSHTGSMELIGYTCAIGDITYNQYLAKNRALNLKKWIVKQGFDDRDITVVAKGESEPVADNNDSNERKLNRRVEVKFKPNLSVSEN